MGCVQVKKCESPDGLQADNNLEALDSVKGLCKSYVEKTAINNQLYVTQTLKDTHDNNEETEYIFHDFQLPLDINIFKLSVSTSHLNRSKHCSKVDPIFNEEVDYPTNLENCKTAKLVTEHFPTNKVRTENTEPLNIETPLNCVPIPRLEYKGSSRNSSTKLREPNKRINRSSHGIPAGRLLNRQTKDQLRSWLDAIHRYFESKSTKSQGKILNNNESFLLSDIKIWPGGRQNSLKNREWRNPGKQKADVPASLSEIPRKQIKYLDSSSDFLPSSITQSFIVRHFSSALKDERLHMDSRREEDQLSKVDLPPVPILAGRSVHDHLSIPLTSWSHEISIPMTLDNSKELAHLPATPFSSSCPSEGEPQQNDQSISEKKTAAESKCDLVFPAVPPMQLSSESSTKDVDSVLFITGCNHLVEITDRPAQKKFPDIISTQDESRRPELKWWLVNAVKLGNDEEVYALTLLGATGLDEATVYAIASNQVELAEELISGQRRRDMFTFACFNIASTLGAPMNQFIVDGWNVVAEMCIDVGHPISISKRKNAERFD